MFALVRTYLSAGKVSEAEAFVKSALQANPSNANAHVLLGTIELVQGKTTPRVSASDGLQNLRVTQAIVQAAHTGAIVQL
mgnify:CR=1 FL=1